jgi:ubiquinone biosynthesis protein
MDWMTLRALDDFGRLAEIASVFIRYGFGDLVRRLDLGPLLEGAGRVLKWEQAEELARLEPPQRVRRALEDLGPTFVKLGQVLASRVDLLSPDWTRELEKLQSAVPPVALESIREQLETDLGAPPEKIFAQFDETPIAAASMAQVHAARLADGTDVVVKVRRPGIRPVVEADLRLLMLVAELAQERVPQLRAYQPLETARQLVLTLRRELDFAAECRSTQRIAENFAGREGLVVPGIHWAWCGERVNVQDRIRGIPGRDLEAIDAAGLDRRRLAQTGARAVLQMILVDGLFHADPHPGNVFFLPDGRLAFVDYGMVGRLSETRRYQVVDLLAGIVERESTKVVDTLAEWAIGDDVDMDRLTTDVEEFIDSYHGVPLGSLDLGAMLADLTRLLRENALVLPPELSLALKVFVTLEGLTRQLDPDFDLATEFRPVLQGAMLERYAPRALARRARRTATELVDLLTGLPRDLRRLIRAVRGGTLQHHVDVSQLDRFGDRMDRAASRLAVSMVTAAFIIGTSIVMSLGEGPFVLGVPLFEILGLGATCGGLFVLYSIWQDRRR